MASPGGLGHPGFPQFTGRGRGRMSKNGPAPWTTEGAGMAISIRNIVLACPEGRWADDHWEGPPRELATFYAELLGMRIIREDWLVIGLDEATTPRLAF